jgi:hypothetical protein
MRIYIIGNDGSTLCREAPAVVNENEIAIASNAEHCPAQRQGAAGAVERSAPRRNRFVVDIDLAKFLEAASYCPQLMK